MEKQMNETTNYQECEHRMSEEVKTLLENAKQNNPMPIKKAQVRHVILAGKIRSGKSTVLNMLRNPIHLAGALSMFADTIEPQLHNTSVTDEKGNNFAISILDTPGLFEHYEAGKQNQMRDNHTIKQMIKKCMQYEIKQVHAIFFVCSFDTGVDKEQIDAFIEFCELFEGAEDKIALIISRAESYPVERKIKLIEEMENTPRLGPLLQKIGGKSNIFFSGCVPQKDVERGWVKTVESKLESVRKMRSKIFEFLFEQTKQPALISALSSLGHYENNVAANVEKFLEQIAAVPDLLKAGNYKQLSPLFMNLRLLKKQVDEDLVFLKSKHEQLKKDYQQSTLIYNSILEDPAHRKGLMQEIINDYTCNKDLMGQDRLHYLHNTATYVRDVCEEKDTDTLELYNNFVSTHNLGALLSRPSSLLPSN